MARPIAPRTNSPHTEGWLKPIGKLVVNFAAIELHTYWWLGAFSKDNLLPSQALGWRFKERVERLRELVSHQISEESLKDRCLKAWDKALEIAKFRNALVHNPIIFGWRSASETGEPDIVGIPDFAVLRPKPRLSQRIASVDDVNARVNETASLAHLLFTLLDECDGALAGK